MITMHVVGDSGGAAKYHDAAFSKDGNVQGADNYYVNEKAQAVWQGKGAELLGIAGQAVKKDRFVQFLEGKIPNPTTGELQDLAKNSRGDKRRLGYDLSIAPSKSVSVAALVGKDDRIVAAHLAANARAMAWLEKHAAIVRVREDGKGKWVNAENFTYATITHVSNRDNEPQLHNHNVIVSAVYDAKAEKWRSLTNDQVMRLRKHADVVYKAELADRLQKLGYDLEYHRNGVDFELAGFSPDQVAGFAVRRAKILEAIQAYGQEPADASFEARRAATLDTRQAKQDLPRTVLDAAWLSTAQELGLKINTIVATAVERSSQRDFAVVLPEPHSVAAVRLDPRLAKVDTTDARKNALRAVSWAVAHLSEREQSFPLTQLETEAVRFGRSTIDDVEWAILTHLDNRLLVERGVSEKGELLFTTERAVTQELKLQSFIDSCKGVGNTVLRDEKMFNTLLAKFEEKKSTDFGSRFRLSNEQVAAAKNVLMHADSIQGVQGDAGTGKTAMLEFVNMVAAERGWHVIGVATSSNAAEQLGRSTGIQSQTVASLLANRQNALKLVERELSDLKSQIAKQGTSLPYSRGMSVESGFLSARSEDINFGRNLYVFDHSKGEVYKSDSWIKATVGTFLMQYANNVNRSSSSPSQVAAFADRVGRAMASFEEVGLVESIAARNALYLNRKTPLTDLERQYYLKQAELNNLRKTGNRIGAKTLLVMEESSMTGISDTVRICDLATTLSARVVFQGDKKQHESVPAGRAFVQAQMLGMNISALKETRRFENAAPEVKAALIDLEKGQYKKALDRIRTIETEAIAEKTAELYVENYQRLQETNTARAPLIGVITLTNDDRREVNAAVSSRLADAGIIGTASFIKAHLDDPKLTAAERSLAGELAKAKVDRLVFRKDYPDIGVRQGDVVLVRGFDKNANRVQIENTAGKEIQVNPQAHSDFTPMRAQERNFRQGDLVETRAKIRFSDNSQDPISNGRRGVIEAISEKETSVRWDNGERITLGNSAMQFLDHAYAHTSHKEQGASNDMEIGAFGNTATQIFNRVATLLTLTRSKGDLVIVTSDKDTMLKNAGNEIGKTTAVDWESDVARVYADLRGSTAPGRQQNTDTSRQVQRAPVIERDGGLSL